MKKITTCFMALTLVLGLALSAQAASFVLGGNILDVGVSSSGGLVNDVLNQGITYKPGPLPNDFTLPGTPFEFYAIGVGGTSAAAGVMSNDTNTFNMVTTNYSTATLLHAQTTNGVFTVGGASLIYTQNVYFDINSSTINFSVDILNAGSTAINNVVYARGLDPDQDVFLGGGYATNNSIGAGTVTAVGPLSNLYITIKDLTGGGVSAISSGWSTDPYVLLGGPNDGNGDYTINMAWNIGTLEAGRSYEIDFQYQIGVVPVPPSVVLLGSALLGLLGLRRKYSA